MKQKPKQGKLKPTELASVSLRFLKYALFNMSQKKIKVHSKDFEGSHLLNCFQLYIHTGPHEQ